MRAKESAKKPVVGDIFDKIVSKPTTVNEDAKLKDVIDLAIQNPIARCIYVVDSKGRVKGAVNSCALLRLVGYKAGIKEDDYLFDLEQITGAVDGNIDGVYSDIICVTKNTEVREALRHMIGIGQDSLPVVDEEGRLICELIGHELLLKYKELRKS